MRYWCDDRRVARGAALLLTGGEETVTRLFSRQTHRAFEPTARAGVPRPRRRPRDADRDRKTTTDARRRRSRSASASISGPR